MTNSEHHIAYREPVVAGRFYPADKDKLSGEIREYFRYAENISTNVKNHPRALIVPHAGYIFSGKVAATAYSLLSKNTTYKNIFLIGSSHHTSFGGASIYNAGDYITPLGKVRVNTQLADKIIAENKIFDFVKAAHLSEHTLEVQLPFLQYIYQNNLQIIPIILGTQQEEDCKEIANALKPYFTPENLFIISTDFSHYPAYNDAVKVDEITAKAIITKDPDVLLRQLEDNRYLRIPNLATSLCGWTSVLTLMYMTEKSDLRYIPIHYENSGDAKLYNEKLQVVGYYALAVIDEEENMSVFQKEEVKREILGIARKTLEATIQLKRKPEISTDIEILHQSFGLFVSVYVKDKLRGCIGKFHTEQPLYLLVQELTVAASSMDSRFEPVRNEELEDTHIEISILSPLRQIRSLDELELGKHGIYIKKNRYSGTFLPQVATKTGWTKEEFVSNCSKNKAGLGSDGWKTAELFIYEAEILKE